MRFTLPDYDVFLIDAATGNVVYTATSIPTAASTSLGRSPAGVRPLVATITVAGLFAAAAVTTHLGADALANRQANTTASALAQARQALISRAASDGNHPGSLPCPDAVTNIAGSNVPNDGIEIGRAHV